VPELCEQCLAAARTAGDLGEQADVLCLMVVAARKGGQFTAARAWLRESAELAVYGGYPLRMIDVVEQGGHLCAATGRPAEAVTLWSAVTAQCEAAGLVAPLQEARDRELVTLVAQGRTDAQIAEQLFISVRTVRTHLDRIRDKSGCRRRADLTRLALQEGII
jgi:DNA-binding CsgD family transcriptional regulator